MGLIYLVILFLFFGNHADISDDKVREKTGKSLEEWKEELDPLEFKVLFENATERAHTGDLLDEKRNGTYVTRACKIPVFRSDHKFESETGWPSFYDVFDEENIELVEDRKFGMKRVEVRSKCGEHLGHVFNDGPDPTGKRFCINSAALDFVPDKK